MRKARCKWLAKWVGGPCRAHTACGNPCVPTHHQIWVCMIFCRSERRTHEHGINRISSSFLTRATVIMCMENDVIYGTQSGLRIQLIQSPQDFMQVAHGVLFETIRQLEDQEIHVPQSLRRSFVLLHSYILVRDYPLGLPQEKTRISLFAFGSGILSYRQRSLLERLHTGPRWWFMTVGKLGGS